MTVLVRNGDSKSMLDAAIATAFLDAPERLLRHLPAD
jgi:hypothetical protein